MESATANGVGKGNCDGKGSSGELRQASVHNKQEEEQILEIYGEVMNRLVEAKAPEAFSPSFKDDLRNHLNKLPAHYAMEVNVERAEDVLMHMKLLNLAHDPATRPAFAVRAIRVYSVIEALNRDFSNADTTGESESPKLDKNNYNPPILPTHPTAVAIARTLSKIHLQNEDNMKDDVQHHSRPLFEITFASDSSSVVLNSITSVLSGLHLDIREAHLFATNDGYALDIFIVSAAHYQETENLENALRKEIQKLKAVQNNKVKFQLEYTQWPPEVTDLVVETKPPSDNIRIPRDGIDEWEIDLELLNFGPKVASGTYGDLYRGTYCSQDVAIKVLRNLNETMHKEFAQEVYIMRKARHKNIVQFIGACTQLPQLCIVTEFMSRGSVYDYLHKKKTSFKLPELLRVALDVAKGMDYLHQNKIIHRDLKTSNLLMDENMIVKVCDFGVARVQSKTGIMTAETGTYRWMAPEVIEHKPYDYKADIFSFAVVLWELLTGKIPYEYFTPVQAAVGVVQKGLRPVIPKDTHPKLTEVIVNCWQQDPAKRPRFAEVIETLQKIIKEVQESENGNGKKKDRTFAGLNLFKH